MDTEITFNDAPIGSIIEMVDTTYNGPINSGRYYKKIGDGAGFQPSARKRFTGETTRIAPTNKVRVVIGIDGF